MYISGESLKDTASIKLYYIYIFYISRDIFDCVLYCLLQVRMFLVVGSLVSNQNAGMSETQQGYLFHTNAVISHKTSQQAHARLVNTLYLRHPWINTASA